MIKERIPSPTRSSAGGAVRIRPFEEGDAAAFRRLNEEWITRYFALEGKDRTMLLDPVGQILALGGHILVAVADDVPVGCCALLFVAPGVFELAKMAVTERHQGRGIGWRLLEGAIACARKAGARRLYLETHSSLRNAIHLYESVGFRRIPPERAEPSPYSRTDVSMELSL